MLSKQAINSFIIILGASFIFYTLIVENAPVYIQITGLILLMVGAYRASTHWAQHKDDHLDE